MEEERSKDFPLEGVSVLELIDDAVRIATLNLPDEGWPPSWVRDGLVEIADHVMEFEDSFSALCLIEEFLEGWNDLLGKIEQRLHGRRKTMENIR